MVDSLSRTPDVLINVQDWMARAFAMRPVAMMTVLHCLEDFYFFLGVVNGLLRFRCDGEDKPDATYPDKTECHR